MNLKTLIPKDKSDVESISNLYKYNFKELKPIANELLFCIADGNWPIAYYMANYLRPHINELTDEIIEVLKSGDCCWISYMIGYFFLDADFDIDSRILQELKRLRDMPSKLEIEEELHILAKDVLTQQHSN